MLAFVPSVPYTVSFTDEIDDSNRFASTPVSLAFTAKAMFAGRVSTVMLPFSCPPSIWAVSGLSWMTPWFSVTLECTLVS